MRSILRTKYIDIYYVLFIGAHLTVSPFFMPLMLLCWYYVLVRVPKISLPSGLAHPVSTAWFVSV